jgi:UDP-N-acetylmuramoyl-tripeptide--D-alanyl-D-alanine ligase
MSVPVELLKQLTAARPFHLESLRGAPFTGVSTDTRTVQAGQLFVALRGEKFDGHQFIPAAFDRGAAAAIADSNWIEGNRAALPAAPLVGVPDTYRALGELARLHRRNFDFPVIGVAGSNGKTTTKELIASVLGRRWNVLKTEGTLNNHIGVPLTLLRLDTVHQAAVVELGTNHPGEVAALCEIAEPTHGLITNIGREHLEFFGTVENVARAEGEMFDRLIECGGTGFVNADEPLIAGRAPKLRTQWRFGFESPDVDVRGVETGNGMLTVQCPAQKLVFETRVNLIGGHQVRNALAAAAVGLHFGVEPAQIGAALESQQPAKHRMQRFEAGGVTILDDTYNANPDSMLAALRTLAALPCRGRRIAALGNMGELGPESESFHREIGETVQALGIDALCTVGDLARFTREAAGPVAGGHCDDREKLLERLQATVRAGDLLLLKASRSMKLDLVVEQLTRCGNTAKS